MKIKDIAARIDEIIPLKLAQDWDNVGLLIGDSQKDVKNILLTIDVTRDVVVEAKKLKTDLIIAYHPAIWDALKKITAEGPTGVVYDLIRSGIAVFSIHTALDSAVGGVNDGLAEIVGIVNGEPIGDYVANPAGDNYKLVVFVPARSAAKVSNAVFAAGAGAIGNYSRCGFGAEGTGTFLPHKGSKPAIGKRGKLEKVGEIRFETIVPAGKLDDVVEAMKKAHPYEMPAFDVFKLHDTELPFGLGRIGELAKPVRIAQIIKRIKKVTGAKAIGLVGKQDRMVRRAAVCAGSCGKIINSVIAAKADLYLTGELKHHQALAAQEAGLTCICLSHTVSERFILKKFARQLQKQIKTITIRISRKDADPFKWKNV
ncbi:MAG TPA: Nif3-like dinuclear metal center hexameric protein [Sedimentisphaerales bacterium]|nr:Nif3-like dinuclear metal center hexameric protein [Sedimentisphaerales bacterium]